MTLILGSISLLLHVIAFYFIFTLIKHVRSLKEKKLADIQQLFDTYITKIKEENDRLQDKILSLSPTQERSHQPDDTTVKNTKANKEQMSRVNDIKAPHQTLTQPTDHIRDTYEPSLQANILRMHDQGYSEEEIAKSLNCGKTEVELIVKFHQKK